MDISMAERVTTSLTILLTGFVVVFLVLILLIGLIKLYGIIVTKGLEIAEAKKAEKEAEKAKAIAKIENETKLIVSAEPTVKSASVDDGGIPQEVIAVIVAAVDAMYGQGAVKVKSIKKVPQSRPVWGTAGIMDNTRPF